MKKLILVLIILSIILIPFETSALSVDKNNLSIEKNSSEAISLYAKVDSQVTGIEFNLIFTTYDIPASFYVDSGLTDTNPSGVYHKIIFPNPTSGEIKLGEILISVVDNPKANTGGINIHSAKAIATNGEVINLNSQAINVKIGEQDEIMDPIDEKPVKNSNLLDRIESEIVQIKLKDDLYEYKVNINEDIEELDLNPVAKDEKYKVEVTTQKISELKDNQIIIKVKDSDITEEYKINVNILKNNKVIDIDKGKFKSTYKYREKWIALIIILSAMLYVGFLLVKKK